MARARANGRREERSDVKGVAEMESTKKAQEAFTQSAGRAVETLGVWADANQRVLRELAELSAATAKESVRLYGEIAQSVVQAMSDAQAQALRWQAALDTDYADAEHGGYYLTAADAEGLIIRPHSTVDDAIPNHNGLIAQNLVRLAVLTGDEQWRVKGDAIFDAILPRAKDNLFGHLSLLSALDMRLNAAEIVVVGQGAEADALLGAARRLPHAIRIVLHARDASALAKDHPAQAKLGSVSGAAAFICRGQTCSLPITEPAGLERALAHG